MSASLTDFETGLLLGLWQASLAMAALSVAVMLALVARRYYENYRAGQRGRRRAVLERVIWGAMASPVPPSLESLPMLGRYDAMLVCDLALDILRPLRGEEPARIVRLLEVWPIRSHVRDMLKRGHRNARVRMLTLLAHFDDDETLVLLKEWIGAADFYVQLAALRSLAERQAIEALPDILRHLARTERQNATMLADVLRRFGEPALDMLTELTAEATQPEVRLAAIAALQAIGSLQASPALVRLASDPLADVRAAAICALARLGDMEGEKVILHALSDREESVRVQAAKAAGRLQLRAAAPLLAAALADPSWWVRYRAAEALYGMGAIGRSFLEARSKEPDRAGHVAAQVLAEKEAA